MALQLPHNVFAVFAQIPQNMTRMTIQGPLPHIMPAVARAPDWVQHIQTYVSEWTLWSLAEIVLRRPYPHYEHQIYSQLNVYLNAIFPSRASCYAVSSQYLIRRSYGGLNPNNTSGSSSGGYHRGRGTYPAATGHQEPFKFIADYLISKIRPRQVNPGLPSNSPDNLPYERVGFCLIEVKKHGMAMRKARVQLRNYMSQLRMHNSTALTLHGILIAQNTAEVLTLTINQNAFVLDSVRPIIDAPGQVVEGLTQLLAELALQYWYL